MNPEEIKLVDYIKELSLSHKKFTDLGGIIMQANNQKMYVMDLLAFAVINRSIQLVEGFVTLVNNNNYLCAIPLIRLQLDNALRFFATNLVKDRNDFFSYFMDGKPINRYKCATGVYLSDNYLAKTLDSIFPGVLNLYTNISGHIHLSDQHVYATKHLDKSKLKPTAIAIGKGVDPFNLALKVDFASTMLEVCKLVFIVVDQWKLEKQKLPDTIPANTPSIIM